MSTPFQHLVIKLYKDGHWHIFVQGEKKGNVVTLGHRDEHYDIVSKELT